MNRIKQMLLSPWDMMRMFRLVIGIWIIVTAVQTRDFIIGLLGVFFLYQALTNTGCCSSGGCYTPRQKANTRSGNTTQNIEYEEIK